jgi:ADP-ribosyl-[dinitrogen reductase] hydrolase
VHDAALDRSVGALVGLAVGDALGAPAEGKARDSYARLSDFAPSPEHGLAAGEWTDDTAMAICLAESLLAYPDLDARDLLGRFLRWYRRGENSCAGAGVGISAATRATLEGFERSGRCDAAADIGNAGNGCIMRLAPVAIRHRHAAEAARRVAERQACTTHTAAEAVAASAALADILVAALATADRARVAQAAAGASHKTLTAIAGGSYRTRTRDEISSAPRAGATLEAALWCVFRTSSFEDALLEAVNLGGDTDTIGAVTGQIAGALYGAAAIPTRWTEGLHAHRRLADLATRLHAAAAAISD